jgi:hypothetical protein
MVLHPPEANADLTTLTRDNIYIQCLQSRTSLMRLRKLEYFLGKRPLYFKLYQDNILLVKLKVSQTQGRKLSESGSLLGRAALTG